MNNPLFSIIIPTYNRSHTILKTISSVIKQTYQNYEVLVIDDGSSDKTKEVVASIKDSRIKYYYKTHNERSAARNFGVKKAEGEYICFLDSDDLLLENYLTEYADKIIQENISAGVYHSGLIIKGRRGIVYGNFYKQNKYKSPFEFILTCKIGIHDFVFNRSVFDKHNFEESLSIFEDKHFLLRVFCDYSLFGIMKHTHIYNEDTLPSSLNGNLIEENLEAEILSIINLETDYSEVIKGKIDVLWLNKIKAKRHLFAAYNYLNLKKFNHSFFHLKQAYNFSRSFNLLHLYLKFIVKLLFIRVFK